MTDDLKPTDLKQTAKPTGRTLLAPTTDMMQFIRLLEVSLNAMTDENVIGADLNVGVTRAWHDKLADANPQLMSLIPGPHLELKLGDLSVSFWGYDMPKFEEEGGTSEDVEPDPGSESGKPASASG